ncbi:hypothetical protein HPP92_000657 [Vanilla planifolia]|uniref:BZIP domain-containing protein n=1 Tax=Vanilla planifolia TaxID=51239 RepID=A0A835RPL1_VANPL|nr:hypothetical protein HPP92_000657 [Vanilla planifolia]
MGLGGSGNGSEAGNQNQIHSSAKQGYTFSLTLNGVQNHVGKSLHDVNLDELVENVFPQEFDVNSSAKGGKTIGYHGSRAGFQSQGSINNASITVDELWRKILHQNAEHRGRALGEMTLEDFLKKAGVIPCGSEKRSNVGTQSFREGSLWLQQYEQMVHQQAQQSQMSAYVSSRPVSIGTGSGSASGQPNSWRKRGATEEMLERTVARRQKRMIKNRESAARSRARKQAYTNELENKILLLEEENEQLRKQKELDVYLRSTHLPEPKNQLCRSFSSPF